MKKVFFLIITVFFLMISILIQKNIYFFEVKTLFNFFLFLVFVFINKKFFQYKLNYMYLWIVISPVLGYLFVIGKKTMLHFQELDKGKDVSIFKNLKKVIKDKSENFVTHIDFNKEINSNSLWKVLRSNDSKMKMDFILKMEEESQNIDENINRLKIFLKDKNIEVIHYAAVKINDYDKKINFKINDAKKKGDKLELIMNYMDYCKSGLLEGPILEAYKEKVVELLQDKETENLLEIEEILKYYKKIDEKKEFFHVLNSAIKSKGINREILQLAIEYCYEQDEYEKIQCFEQLLSEGV